MLHTPYSLEHGFYLHECTFIYTYARPPTGHIIGYISVLAKVYVLQMLQNFKKFYCVNYCKY